MSRSRSRSSRAALVAIALLASAIPSLVLEVPASGEPARSRPQGPAKVALPADFPALVDSEWGFPLGGFGGVSRGAPLTHVPVIFVHGNNVDAADWYPVRDSLRRAGWSDQELWALSYNGLGSNNGSALFTPNPQRDAEHRQMGSDGLARVTNNDINVADLYSFITSVRDYTGSKSFVLVSHSLGVTLARRTLKLHPELRGDLVAFVGIAGANHGTSFCPPGSEGNVVSCDEIAAGTRWLADLNGPGGADETYGPARWLTIYDGSGAGDPAYAGPAYAQSPALRGADNRQFPGTYHNDLRLDPAIVDLYRTFIADAEKSSTPASSAGPGPTLPSGPAGGNETSASAGDLSSGRPLPSAVSGRIGRSGSRLGPSSVPTAPAAPSSGSAADTAAAPALAPGRATLVPASGASNRPGIGPRAASTVWANAGLFVLGALLLGFDRRKLARARALS